MSIYNCCLLSHSTGQTLHDKVQMVSWCILFVWCFWNVILTFSFSVCLSKVAGAYSKTWSYREDALLAVYKKLMEVPPGTPKAELRSMTRAAVFLCKKALTDKVSSVRELPLYLYFTQSFSLILSPPSYVSQPLLLSFLLSPSLSNFSHVPIFSVWFQAKDRMAPSARLIVVTV